MYAGFGFRSFEIGDVDVLRHDGRFHLFHLILPNHDYIAHAVSDDGLVWQRVENALFIGDPGAWDDDMLWTMHVSEDPEREGCWRMAYTGLCMREGGRIQRIGMARSNDLYRWHKIVEDAYPLTADPAHYEADLSQGRHWISYRDPFVVRVGGRRFLLAAARVRRGPLIRRGCVALVEEVAPNRWQSRPPLFHPMRYDDVEVPNLLELEGRFYLLGSIREDVKVHYWYADAFEGPYRNFSDNVLLPQGNYAARVCHDPEEDRHLVWNFFIRGSRSDGEHLLPPPKELFVDEGGELRLRSFSGFDDRVEDRRDLADLTPFEPLFGNRHAGDEPATNGRRIGSASGLEVFLLPGVHVDYRLNARIEPEGSGKFGLALHLDEEGSGYFLSLDTVKGLAQIRCWGRNRDRDFESAFHYRQLQASHFVLGDAPYRLTLISYGTYIELAIDGVVRLSLSDDRYRRGRTGFYVESGRVRITDVRLETLSCPPNEPYLSQDPADED